MKGTDILKQIGDCDKIIELLEEELLSFEKTYAKTQSKRLKHKILKIKCEIDNEITRQAMLKIKAHELIQGLKNEKEKWVIIYHFICLLTIEQTAQRLNYSARHTLRLCNSACEKIDAQYQNKSHNI